MEIHAGGVGHVPIKSTGPSAQLRDGPQYCRPQNQWAPDQETEKWEKEIQDIFSGEEHKFEEAEILADSKDFPTHSGVQTPMLNAAIGEPKSEETNEPRDEIQKSVPSLSNREEFPSLGKDLNEQGENKQLFGNSRQEEPFLESEKMPRHGVPLEEFIDLDNAGQKPQNIEGKVAEHRSETAPGSGIHLGKGLKQEISKSQAEPELTPPDETDKEKDEMKEVHSVVDDVKHVVEVVGSKIAHGAHEVKEMLSDAVHHLTTTTEASDSAKKATDETGYNTCA